MNNSQTLENELQHLRICGSCYSLYETGRADRRNQRCRCVVREERTWPGFDFNERASLCLCCGMEVLESGSRWSPYFCRTCQALAKKVSIRHRRLVFPIGRHSLMHTWVPEARLPTLGAHRGNPRELAKTVHAATTAVATGTEGLRQWSGVIVSRHLRHLGLPGGTPLREYLAAVAGKGTGYTRRAAFAELCEFFNVSMRGAN